MVQTERTFLLAEVRSAEKEEREKKNGNNHFVSSHLGSALLCYLHYHKSSLSLPVERGSYDPLTSIPQ